jgi:RNA polymerase sigma factor (sigma-70 family)
MEKKHLLHVKITNEYGGKLLNWAVRKTGNRADGEDLAQEVFLQVFLAIEKQDHIEKPEHFIWKVARYVWCKRVREMTKHSASELSETLPDGADGATDYAENEAFQNELSRMRRALADLSRLQREMMILHYLDGFSVREVAARLGATESAVTWQLFDARKQIREELNLKDENACLYRPGKLDIGYSGEAPAYPDTQKVRDSLIRQNLCLLCHSEGKTIDELADATGIPKPFLEYDLDWACRT